MRGLGGREEKGWEYWKGKEERTEDWMRRKMDEERWNIGKEEKRRRMERKRGMEGEEEMIGRGGRWERKRRRSEE